MDHVTLTTPLLGVVGHLQDVSTGYRLHNEFDGSNISRSTDITRTPKILMVHVT